MMKRAQLAGGEIPCSILLVDMDGCQIAWVIRQQVKKFGKQVFAVGDPAQTIYGFRGAKSKFLMQLPYTRSFKLTKACDLVQQLPKRLMWFFMPRNILLGGPSIGSTIFATTLYHGMGL
mmetsp:Transcript_9504/g.19151  ORF Transcript_9504/g.19151 Transcript_9504/m.19151 type:complete len:119 (+) Transcript_9504:784-1140(+)|eukprot:scaffold516_cov175-Amphora_coffeaeformis.AAC.35